MACLSNYLFACVILFLSQYSAGKSLGTRCYVCKEQDLETDDGYFASGSAISSQFLLPDGSVVTNSKETAISSDGIKKTFHELKKEADRFVQTGTGGVAVHHVPPFSDIAPIAHIPKLPIISAPTYYTTGSGDSHSSYSQLTKEQSEMQKKLINTLSPSVSSKYEQFQTQNNVNGDTNLQIPCDVCAQHAAQSEGSASYSTIVGSAPVVSSSYQKHESSSQKNLSQTQPIFMSNLKPNTFTTNVIDFNNFNHNGPVSETDIKHHSSSNQVKVEEYEKQYENEQKTSSSSTSQQVVGNPAYVGPVSHVSKVVVGVSGPAVVNSQSYQKKETSSHVESGNHAVPVSNVYVHQAGEAEISKNQNGGFRSPILLGGVPQNIPLDQQAGSYQSSSGHSYYSSSSSSSKVETSADGTPIVIHGQPQSFSSSSGYSSSSGSASGNSHPNSEFYYNGKKVQGASSSIYDHAHDNVNAETIPICTTCTYSSSGGPIRNSYGIATSFSSQSSTINGKTTENREAAVSVNDNGKVDSYHVKS